MKTREAPAKDVAARDPAPAGAWPRARGLSSCRTWTLCCLSLLLCGPSKPTAATFKMHHSQEGPQGRVWGRRPPATRAAPAPGPAPSPCRGQRRAPSRPPSARGRALRPGSACESSVKTPSGRGVTGTRGTETRVTPEASGTRQPSFFNCRPLYQKVPLSTGSRGREGPHSWGGAGGASPRRPRAWGGPLRPPPLGAPVTPRSCTW